MATARTLLLILAMASLPAKSDALEIKLVKFICSSEGAVVSVVSRVDDLIIGLSPLPSGCSWLPPRTYGTIGETMFQVGVPGGKIARVSRIKTKHGVGFSAGLIEFLS